MDLHPVQGLAHAEGMVIAYLPTEKILISADMYSPPAPGAQPPAAPSANMVSLHRNVQRLKLDVEQHVPLHGRVGDHAEFLSLVEARE